ncbi:MAG: hypothetical protein JWR35_3663 [Marmoricola sp.]|nr:hypothetical protein [Marmoricola sp.]
MLFTRIRNFSPRFIEQFLTHVRPVHDGIISIPAETETVTEMGIEVQTLLSNELEKLARAWLNGEGGKAYTVIMEDCRAKSVKIPRLTPAQLEESFGFTPGDYQRIWHPIAFVLDPLVWNPKGPFRAVYDELRVSTLAIIGRYITVLTTGRLKGRTITNSVMIRVYNATSAEDLSKEWPGMLPKGERPQTTTAWEEYPLDFAKYRHCPGYKDMWARIEPEKEPVFEEARTRECTPFEEVEADGDEQEVPNQRAPDAKADANTEQRGNDVIADAGPPPARGLPTNSAAGTEANEDAYDTNGTALVRRESIHIDSDMESVGPEEDGVWIKEEEPYNYDDMGVIPKLPAEFGTEFNGDSTVGDPWCGLVSLGQFAEIDRENREDFELDSRIIELLRPLMSKEVLSRSVDSFQCSVWLRKTVVLPSELTESLNSYVCEEAVKIALMGPLGQARWGIAACQEIVRRTEDLYLLLDRKIARANAVIEKFEREGQTAIESVEILDRIRNAYDDRVDETANAKKKRDEARKWAADQRASRARQPESKRMEGLLKPGPAPMRRGGLFTPAEFGVRRSSGHQRNSSGHYDPHATGAMSTTNAMGMVSGHKDHNARGRETTARGLAQTPAPPGRRPSVADLRRVERDMSARADRQASHTVAPTTPAPGYVNNESATPWVDQDNMTQGSTATKVQINKWDDEVEDNNLSRG